MMNTSWEFNKVISKVISKTNSDVKCLMLATSAYVQAHSKSLNENIGIKAKSVNDIEIAKSVPNFSVFIETAELKMEEDMKINKKLELNN